jgi:hypothetical protein
LSGAGRRKSRTHQNRRPKQRGRATGIKNLAKSSPEAGKPGDANQGLIKIAARSKEGGRRESRISQIRRLAQENRATGIKNLAKSPPEAKRVGDANQESRKIVARSRKTGRRESRITQNRRPKQRGRATQIKNLT